MEPRLLLAYAIIALLVLGAVLGWRKLTTESRRDRRAERRGLQARRRRREERLSADEAK
jgi:type II secretory pathway pseudopilin PulG